MPNNTAQQACWTRALVGALSMAGIFCFIEPIHRAGLATRFWPTLAVFVLGAIWGATNSTATIARPRVLMNGMFCGIGAVLFANAMGTRQGELGYNVFVFPPVGLLIIPFVGAYFNLLSTVGDVKVSGGNSIASISFTNEYWKSRAMAGLSSGFIASIAVVIFATLPNYLLSEMGMLFVEGLVLGGLLVLRGQLTWRRI